MSGPKIKLEDLNIPKYLYQFIKNEGLDIKDSSEFEERMKNYIRNMGHPEAMDLYYKYRNIADFYDGKGQLNPSLLKKDHKLFKMIKDIEEEVKKELKWYDNTDAMIDYFDTAFYIDFEIGKWNKPYKGR